MVALLQLETIDGGPLRGDQAATLAQKGNNEFEKAGATVDKVAKAQFELDCKVDHANCRQLLIKLKARDLRQRLESSPYDRNNMEASQSWLREAAEAFGVSLKRAPGDKRPPFKSKQELINDVIAAVASAAKDARDKERPTVGKLKEYAAATEKFLAKQIAKSRATDVPVKVSCRYLGQDNDHVATNEPLPPDDTRVGRDVQGPQPIQVHADAPVPTPCPSSEKLSTSNFFNGMFSVFWAELSYGALISMTLQLLDPDGCAPTALLVVVGSMLAQIWSSLQLALVERWLGSPVHDPHCRAFQACHAFVVWSRQHSIVAGVLAAIFTYGACPRLLLWLPILKRPAAPQMDDQPPALAMPIPKRRRGDQAATLQSRRYDQNFWGLAWKVAQKGNNEFEKAGATVDKVAKAQFELDCKVDHANCRQLLIKLKARDLRQRLESSPYDRNNMEASQSWLREAAEAFGVSLKRAPGDKRPPFKSKQELINDVIAAVASAAKDARDKERPTVGKLKEYAAATEKFLAKQIAKSRATDVPVKVSCRYLGQDNDHVATNEPLPPDDTRVGRDVKLRFLFIACFADGRTEEQRHIVRAMDVCNRGKASIPNNWIASLRAAELPDIARSSATTIAGSPGIKDNNCEYLGLPKPAPALGEGVCVSAIIKQEVDYVLAAHVKDDLWLPSCCPSSRIESRYGGWWQWRIL